MANENKNTNTAELSIIAQALVYNRRLTTEKINATSLGDYSLARKWRNAILDLLIPAYRVWAFYHDEMGKTTETKERIDQTPLYNALKVVLDLIGEVRGEKLNAKNCADAIICEAHAWRDKDITQAMAHAREERRLANTAKNKLEKNPSATEEELTTARNNYDYWDDEFNRLKKEPDNCVSVPCAPKDAVFIKAVEKLLGDAISGQLAKSADEIEAERLAKAEARKAARKAAKAAKAAKANA